MEAKMRKEKKGQERAKSKESEFDETKMKAVELLTRITTTEKISYSKETLETIENIN